MEIIRLVVVYIFCLIEIFENIFEGLERINLDELFLSFLGFEDGWSFFVNFL